MSLTRPFSCLARAMLAFGVFLHLPAVAQSDLPSSNPFSRASTLDFAFPRFDLITAESFRPAFEVGMAQQVREVQAIRSSQPVTFENTLVALERSGRLLQRVQKTFANLNTANGTAALQAIELEMAPRVQRHRDQILLDQVLFDRIQYLAAHGRSQNLDPQSARLLARYRDVFTHAGAGLSASKKKTLRSMNERLAGLSARFRQNVRMGARQAAPVFTEAERLDGLSPEDQGVARAAAEARDLEGWVLNLQSTTSQPALALLSDRSARERLFRASISRANVGPADNSSVIAEIVEIRARKAVLLGYQNYASYVLADTSARNVEAVETLLRKVAQAAQSKAATERAALQEVVDRTSQPRLQLQPWDWPYYARQAFEATSSAELSALREYFELNSVLENGLFFVAHELYGLSFKERKDLPLYHSDVRVFEVREAPDKAIGLLLLDYYARDGKHGGAWEDSFVDQSELLGDRPVVANYMNIAKPERSAPTLLSYGEMTTMFHEFGHALHMLLTQVRYPSLGATKTPPDFFEFPSQLHEMWVRDPLVVGHFAKHYRTGEALPERLLNSVLAAQRSGQGFAVLEGVEAAIIDQALHRITPATAPGAQELDAFENAALSASNIRFPEIPSRYGSTYFTHIFSGGYEGSYYSFVWSEVLARAAGEWFTKHGGLTRENGTRFRETILSRGRSAHPAELFESFYGRPAELGPYLDYRGLTHGSGTLN